MGPIWGDYEAGRKVYDFLHHNPAFARDNEWTGVWVSRNSTSYA